MKRLTFVLTIGVLFFLACTKFPKINMSKEKFLSENLSQSYDSWKNWTMSYGSGKFIAVYESDSSGYKEQLIFWETDSVWIRLTLPDTISKVLSIKTFPNDSLWDRYRQMNVEDLRSHINFILKNGLDHVSSFKNPDRLYFHSDSINLLYLFVPVDSGWGLYKNQLNTNWYYQ